jgi:hypothetical protein
MTQHQCILESDMYYLNSILLSSWSKHSAVNFWKATLSFTAECMHMHAYISYTHYNRGAVYYTNALPPGHSTSTMGYYIHHGNV